MPVSDGLLKYVLEQMSAMTGLTSRRMFGGVGIYADGAMFAVMDDDQIYFRVDNTTRPRYKALGSKPWEPMPGREKPSESYYELPHDILDDRERLVDWARRAAAVARVMSALKRKSASRKKSASKKKASKKKVSKAAKPKSVKTSKQKAAKKKPVKKSAGRRKPARRT